MLGNVATQIEDLSSSNPAAMKIASHRRADALLRSEYRKGWSL